MSTINTRAEKTNFYRTVLALVIPMALQNLINVGVQAADVVMLGRLNEVAISAASLAGQVYFIMTLFFFGLTSGAAVLTAQYWGKGDTDTIEKILALALRTAVVTACIFAVAAFCFPVQIMHLFSSEEPVIAEGAKYMRIVSLAYIPGAFTMVYLNTMRSVERVIISTVTYTISLFVNIILNAVLIFGLLGAPALGVRGAAVATMISRWVEFCIVIFYALRMNDTVRLRKRYLLRTDSVLVKDFVKYALPVTVNELLWGGGTSVITAIIGHMGSTAAAANSVVGVVRQLALVITFGVASATAIILGKTIGEGKKDFARVYASRFMKITIILGILGALMIVGISPVIRSVMTLGAESKEYLKGMMYVMAYCVMASGINTVLIVGVFRAGGDTKYGLLLDCTALWCVSILFGSIAAFALEMPVVTVYIILTCDEVIKLPFAIRRYRQYKWLTDVTRTAEELNV